MGMINSKIKNDCIFNEAQVNEAVEIRHQALDKDLLSEESTLLTFY